MNRAKTQRGLADDATRKKLADARHRILDALEARCLGGAVGVDLYRVNGKPLLVSRHASGGFDLFVPVSASISIATTQAAAESWAKMDTRIPGSRVAHADVPPDHEVGAPLASGRAVAFDTGEAPTRWYTTAEARAIAWELLHAADLADDAASKAGGQ